MDRLQSFGSVRAVDADKRRVTVIASTDQVARDGFVIDQRGWDLSAYEMAPVVLWGHDDRQLPIAKTVESRSTDHELIQVHEFATHARAEEVWQAVVNGFVHATSVRWLPGETEMRMVDGKRVLAFSRGHQLLETSYVSLPADPGAVVLRANGEAVDMSQFLPAEEPTEPEPATAAVQEPSLAERFLKGFAKKEMVNV